VAQGRALALRVLSGRRALSVYVEDIRWHIRHAERGRRCEAVRKDGSSVIGTLTNVGTLAFGLRLPSGATTAVRYAECDHVICELSL
jgi:hypothetical protein